MTLAVNVGVRLLAMGRKVRSLWPAVAVTVIAAGTVWLVYVVWRSPHRIDLATFGSYAVAVAVIAAGLITRAWQARTGQPGDVAGAQEIDQLTDLLAGAVKGQWTCAAADRGLLEPEPIPVRWRRPSLPIAGPVSAAVGSRRFSPLPGLPAVSSQRLRSGQIADLHAVYGGLGSGRLVIAGAPGAGKSGAAVLLLLAALKHRDEVLETERPLVPVPVIFTLHEWDPNTQRVQEWLTARLQQTYPLLGGKSGGGKASQLLAAGKLAVILDGLDEIPEALRPVALRALSQQAAFRLVVLTRSAEMAAAASHGLLEGAAAVELQDVDAVTAAGYLRRVQLHPPPRGWNELTRRLRRTADSSLAQALSSPLTLTLVRDTYRDEDDIRELLDFCDAADRRIQSDAIVDHLLDRVLPAAYARRPGYRPPRYDLRSAQHALRCLASRMNQDGTRDLQWWRLRDWTPAIPRIIATGLAFGLGVGVVGVLAVGLAFGFAVGLTAALAFGLLVGFRSRSTSPMAPRTLRQVLGPSSLVYALPVALAVGLPVGLAVGLTVGLPVGLTSGLALGIAGALAAGLTGAFTQPGVNNAGALRNAGPLSPRASWRSNRAAGLAFGLAFGLAVGLAFGLAIGLAGGLAGGLAAGLTAGLAVGLTAARAAGLGIALIAAVAVGLPVGLAAGLTGGHRVGLATGLTAGLASGLALGLAGGLMYTRTWSSTLAFAQLAARWNTPIRLMRFLEDARERNILRAVGPVYQFRHARLQDRLAEQAFVAMQNRGGSAKQADVKRTH